VSTGRQVTLGLPIYLLVERRRRRSRLAPLPAAITLPTEAGDRRCLLAYRTRQSAAAWIERAGGHLRPHPVLSEISLDRVAELAQRMFGCRWLALEPDPNALAAELLVDLERWTAQRAAIQSPPAH
jgi:hypothetical protein